MSKGPGLYDDMGKKARDLLYNNYQSVLCKTTMTELSPMTGEVISSSGSTDYYLRQVLLDVNVQPQNKNIRIDFKADIKEYRSFNLLGTIAIDEVAPGLKQIFSFGGPDRSRKVELQYLHDYAGISTSVGLAGNHFNPIVNFSGLVGTNGLALGTDVCFDPKLGTFSKYNAGLSFTSVNTSASLNLIDKADTLSYSFYHGLSPLTNTAFGFEGALNSSTNKDAITVGAQLQLNSVATLKTKVNHLGKASAVLQLETKNHPKSFFSFSAEFDTRSRYVVESAKFGYNVAINYNRRH